MKTGWRECQLGDVIELKRGYDLPERERRAGSVPIVSSSGVSGTHESAKVKGPGVVTGRYGTLGEVFLVRQDFWPLNTTLYVRDFKGNDPRFISYFLRTLDFFAYSDKAAVPGLNRNHLHQAKVVCPPVEAQQRIADTLGSLDDKIELNRRTNETLEAMARTLFRSWFVDFDPVRAKADGQKPQGMDATTAKLFPDSFEPSAIGPIPKGWKVLRLPEAIAVNPSRSLSKDTVAPYLEMANMPTASARALAWELRSCGSGAKFVNGDVLLARITPCLENGKTAFVDFLNASQVGWGSTEYIVFRSKPPLPPEFAYFLARSPELRSHAIQNMTGTSGRQRVPAECFNSYPVVVPSAPLAARFGEWCQPIMAMMKARDEESRTLAATRDALLPKLLSGEVTALPLELSK